MQFVAQVKLSDTGNPALGSGLLLLFQCQNDPGMCDEWDPNAGGNRAIVVRAGKLHVQSPPKGGDLLLPHFDVVDVQTSPESYEKARQTDARKLLGQLGGTPDWVQDEETPNCACGKPMLFAAQLEASGGGGINFGDVGCGYAFVCGSCKASAKFLFQSH